MGELLIETAGGYAVKEAAPEYLGLISWHPKSKARG
jgi:hypothetical protein